MERKNNLQLLPYEKRFQYYTSKRLEEIVRKADDILDSPSEAIKKIVNPDDLGNERLTMLRLQRAWALFHLDSGRGNIKNSAVFSEAEIYRDEAQDKKDKEQFQMIIDLSKKRG